MLISYHYCCNYCGFAAFIGNFGVVPLLRFIFFLLAPIFLCLLALILLVFFVFDAITMLLLRYLTILTAFWIFVKISSCFLSTIPYSQAADRPEDIILATGEHYEFKEGHLKNFSLGNPQIIAVKYFPQKGLLLIKAKKMGHSEIIIFRSKHPPLKLQIYVFSKREHLKLVHLMKNLKSLGLKVHFKGKILFVSGKIKNIWDYYLLVQLKKDYPNHLFVKSNLTKKLKNKIIGQIYYLFFNEYIQDFSCELEGIQISCYYHKNTPPSSELTKKLKSRYLISLLGMAGRYVNVNYLIKLKLVQMEKADGMEFSLGLDQISSSLHELFELGIKGFLQKHNLFLKENKILISTLAEPQSVVYLGSDNKMEIGANISYEGGKSCSDNRPIIQWKFAGLKIKYKLLPAVRDNELQMTYHIEFTRPMGKKIIGNKESSRILIRVGSAQELFQVGLYTQGEELTQIPGLSSIPLLGKLFTSNSNRSAYKKVYGIITVEEYE